MREAMSFLPGRTGVIVIGHGLDLSCGVSSRMRKTSAAGVLASLSGSPYCGEDDSPRRPLRPCWTVFLRILRGILLPIRRMR